MSEERKYNYGFLFRKSKLPNVYLNALVNTEDFPPELDKILAKGGSIDDIERDIYEVVKKMYYPKFKSGERSGYARMLCKATKSFSKIICDDENAWKRDFEEFE